MLSVPIIVVVLLVVVGFQLVVVIRVVVTGVMVLVARPAEKPLGEVHRIWGRSHLRIGQQDPRGH